MYIKTIVFNLPFELCIYVSNCKYIGQAFHSTLLHLSCIALEQVETCLFIYFL